MVFFFPSLGRHNGPLVYHLQEPLVKPKHSFVNLVRTFVSMRTSYRTVLDFGVLFTIIGLVELRPEMFLSQKHSF